MAEKELELDREVISCSICLDLLKDPVTIPCGHSYCMNCIKTHWDQQDEGSVYSCPQCRQTFTPRPVLGKNTVLAHLVEELKKTGLQPAPADHCFAGPEDVACDVCPGRKRKALNSCLVCLASYCERHLQPHFEVPPLKKHKLVNPSNNLQKNVCSSHDEVMKIFCRTDQQPICYLCSMDGHKGHDTVSAAAERAEKQKNLEASRRKIQRRVEDREKNVEQIQESSAHINYVAHKAVQNSEKTFTDLIRLMEKRRSDVKQQVRSQQKTDLSRLRDLREAAEQEIAELKRKDAELEELSQAEDHIQFLQNYPSQSALSQSSHSSVSNAVNRSPLHGISTAVSEIGRKIEDILMRNWIDGSQSETPGDVLLLNPQPLTRADLFKYYVDITLDPNTAHPHILLSARNKKATLETETQTSFEHLDRFTDYWQVLSNESVTGRGYWEVKWRGGLYIAVTYQSISRGESCVECVLGHNDKSWALDCDGKGYRFWHNQRSDEISGSLCTRIGVYVDHSEGILSFYSITGVTRLIHGFHTHFDQPLYAGIGFYYPGDSAEFCRLK
ncbi:tripartite motif-containing protein 16-like [Xyrichtys novacula]|uniref:Tripartite motif-containing protein 16-like n=1 Tax=Xyrichtys novacula TaxID=13765 RepID=A0AAV1GHN3_XYRNO|nr:tripartite motif-containing protein 16-like [Xyrichtys novacula]